MAAGFLAVSLGRAQTGTLPSREAILIHLHQGERARISRGAYGTCVDCGEEISLKRLAAAPWASLCLECQNNLDAAKSANGLAA